jgi:hypothetical protein
MTMTEQEALERLDILEKRLTAVADHFSRHSSRPEKTELDRIEADLDAAGTELQAVRESVPPA